jgi:hypothetical protein
MNKFLFILIPILLTGCASNSFSPRFEKTGKFDISSTSEINSKADNMSWSEAKEVVVFLAEGPDGMHIDSTGLAVYDNAKWELLGKVSASPNTGGNIITYAFNKYPEDQQWRNTYCKINGGFLVLTVGFWNFTPFPWPCQVRNDNSVEDVDGRKLRIVNTLKKAVKAADGDLVLISALGNIEYKTSSGQTFSTTEMMSAEGYAFKKLN